MHYKDSVILGVRKQLHVANYQIINADSLTGQTCKLALNRASCLSRWRVKPDASEPLDSGDSPLITLYFGNSCQNVH